MSWEVVLGVFVFFIEVVSLCLKTYKKCKRLTKKCFYEGCGGNVICVSAGPCSGNVLKLSRKVSTQRYSPFNISVKNTHLGL